MEIIKPEGLKKITAGLVVPGCVCSSGRDSARQSGGEIGMCAGSCDYGTANRDANANLASSHSVYA